MAKFEVSHTPPYAKDYKVKNYYGEMSFLKGAAMGSLNELNIEDLQKDGPWTDNAEPLTVEERFGKSHKFGNDSQRCTVIRPVGIKEGVDTGMMELKESTPYIL